MNWNSWLVNVYGDNWGKVGVRMAGGGQQEDKGQGPLHNVMPYSCTELFNSILETIPIVFLKLVSN